MVILKDVLFVSVQCAHLVLQVLLLLQHLKWRADILNDNLGSASLGLRVDALVVGLINAPFLHLSLKQVLQRHLGGELMLELVPEGLLAEPLSQLLVGAVRYRVIVSLSVGLQITLASIYRGFNRVLIRVI